MHAEENKKFRGIQPSFPTNIFMSAQFLQQRIQHLQAQARQGIVANIQHCQIPAGRKEQGEREKKKARVLDSTLMQEPCSLCFRRTSHPIDIFVPPSPKSSSPPPPPFLHLSQALLTHVAGKKKVGGTVDRELILMSRNARADRHCSNVGGALVNLMPEMSM